MKIIHGEALGELKKLDSDSVDCVITDPPYGYSFMGKDWDKAVPSVEVWAECLRVLKPGAFAFVMSAPRSDVQMHMIENITKAGFRMDFTPIYWTYASGFPKAGNIGKLVDKRNGRDGEDFKKLGEYLRKSRGKTPQKEIAKHFPSKSGGTTGCVANWELGLNVPTASQWDTLKTLLPIDDSFNELIEREHAKREVLSRKRQTVGGNGIYGKYDDEVEVTRAETEKAKALDGSYAGFQPKPAVEVILVAMKPLIEKTYVDQAMKNGKGVTWLDDGRIPTEQGQPIALNRHEGYDSNSLNGSTAGKWNGKKEIVTTGRFPANLLVSDDVLNNGNQKGAGSKRGSGEANQDSPNSLFLKDKGSPNNGMRFGDSGSYSRYFDIDKWWNERIKDLPESVRKTFPFMIVPKAGKAEKNKGLGGLTDRQTAGGGGGIGDYANDVNSASGKYGSEKAPAKNYHPTVKPLKLMSYLVTLGSRPGDTVVDPFVGSGTTCIAAKTLKREYIGIELDKEYVKIAEARLKSVQDTLL